MCLSPDLVGYPVSDRACVFCRSFRPLIARIASIYAICGRLRSERNVCGRAYKFYFCRRYSRATAGKINC
nr:MAG TPA: hypothetical protein [Caudoviricetes sp.]